jgi:hypothetical protein
MGHDNDTKSLRLRSRISRSPDALVDTPAAFVPIVERWTDSDFERSYAPGKWSIEKC